MITPSEVSAAEQRMQQHFRNAGQSLYTKLEIERLVDETLRGGSRNFLLHRFADPEKWRHEVIVAIADVIRQQYSTHWSISLLVTGDHESNRRYVVEFKPKVLSAAPNFWDRIRKFLRMPCIDAKFSEWLRK